MKTRTFTRDDPALPMHYPGFVFRTLIKEGCDVEALLAGTGLSEQLLEDPNNRIAFWSLRRFILNAIEQSNDQHLGPRLALRFEPAFIGLPAYAAMNAARFEDALDVLSRFYMLTFPNIEFAVVGARTSGEVAIRLRPKLPLGDIAYFVSSSALIACSGLFNVLMRREGVALYGEMMISKPEGWATVGAKLGFPVRFDAAENQLVIPVDLLDQPLPGADPINHARLVEFCEKAALLAGYETTPVSLVVSFLEEPGNISASLSQAAAALGHSERGLRRKLEQSGTSYRKLVERVQEVRAREMLANTTHPINDIAHEIGYETPSNFARSFKRWTGMTPKAFRDSRNTQDVYGQN
jgi:AraC-like DNA-binding protein